MKLNHLLGGWRWLAIATAIVVTIFAVILTRSATRGASPAAHALLSYEVAVASVSPADRQIQAAQRAISHAPSKAQNYNLLCAAFLQKARETEDAAFSDRAEVALTRSLELDANVKDSNFDALKLQAMLRLNQHRFAEGLEAARRAQSLRPDDHQVYGLLTDANVELGNYPAAVEAADKMAALRPSASVYTRISYLRALHGHTEPALEAMRLALRTTSRADVEGLAWTHVHLGHELGRVGRWSEAEKEFDAALRAFPDYGLALEAKAGARAAAGDLTGAIRIYQQVLKSKPQPHLHGVIGDLYAQMGQAEEAQKSYALIERSFPTLELALYWANHDVELNKALALARSERAARADIYTCDLLAWCLYKKGQVQEAQQAITEALRLGTRDARLFYHAGMIYDAAGDRAQAVKYLKLALATNAAFDVKQANLARQTLKRLEE